VSDGGVAARIPARTIWQAIARGRSDAAIRGCSSGRDHRWQLHRSRAASGGAIPRVPSSGRIGTAISRGRNSPRSRRRAAASSTPGSFRRAIDVRRHGAGRSREKRAIRVSESASCGKRVPEARSRLLEPRAILVRAGGRTTRTTGGRRRERHPRHLIKGAGIPDEHFRAERRGALKDSPRIVRPCCPPRATIDERRQSSRRPPTAGQHGEVGMGRGASPAPSGRGTETRRFPRAPTGKRFSPCGLATFGIERSSLGQGKAAGGRGTHTHAHRASRRKRRETTDTAPGDSRRDRGALAVRGASTILPLLTRASCRPDNGPCRARRTGGHDPTDGHLRKMARPDVHSGGSQDGELLSPPRRGDRRDLQRGWERV